MARRARVGGTDAEPTSPELVAVHGVDGLLQADPIHFDEPVAARAAGDNRIPVGTRVREVRELLGKEVKAAARGKGQAAGERHGSLCRLRNR